VTFEIEVGGRTRTVSVEAVTTVGLDGGLFRVRIDGVAHEVDARTTELGITLAHMDSGRSADVAVTYGAASCCCNCRRPTSPLWWTHGGSAAGVPGPWPPRASIGCWRRCRDASFGCS